MGREAEIVRFTEGDIPFGKMLTDSENWHRTIGDWKRLLLISPSGMFKARIDGIDVGVAGLLAYDKVAWIHSVIVLKEFRRRGIGRALMGACVDLAKDLGILCVKLDSVRGFEDFYKEFGFVEEFESRRFLRNGARFPRAAEPIDRECFGQVVLADEAAGKLDRSRVLDAIYKDAPELAFCICAPSGPRGYVLGRRGEPRIQIGPCVVPDGDPVVATNLISSLVGSEPAAKFRMCVPGNNINALKVASELGFESVQSSTRMYLGQKFEEPASVFAMISPEKG